MRHGFIVSSNGSPAGNSFMALFYKEQDSFRGRENQWLEQMKLEGVMAVHPDDGWVDRKENYVIFSYPQYRNAVKEGDIVVLGHHTAYRRVKVIRIEPSKFSVGDTDITRYYFQEI